MKTTPYINYIAWTWGILLIAKQTTVSNWSRASRSCGKWVCEMESHSVTNAMTEPSTEYLVAEKRRIKRLAEHLLSHRGWSELWHQLHQISLPLHTNLLSYSVCCAAADTRTCYIPEMPLTGTFLWVFSFLCNMHASTWVHCKIASTMYKPYVKTVNWSESPHLQILCVRIRLFYWHPFLWHSPLS